MMLKILSFLSVFLLPIISNANNIDNVVKDLLFEQIQNHNFDKLEISCPFDKNYQINNIDIKITNLDIKKRFFKVNFNYQNENKILACKYKELILIPVFKLKIMSGYIIEEADLTEKYFDTNQISHQIVTSIDDIVSKTPKQIIQAYTPIKKSSLHTPFMINKNDLISAIYHKNSIKMQISVIALDSGAKGDIIRVKNTRSNAILSGEVINNNIVKIE